MQLPNISMKNVGRHIDRVYRFFTLLLVGFIFFFLNSPGAQENLAIAGLNKPSSYDFWQSSRPPWIPGFLGSSWSEIEASSIVDAMSEEEILAQIFMVGYSGTSPSKMLMEWIQLRGIGGVKIFGWNATDTTVLAQTIRTIQTASLERPGSIPLLVATDQEGGWIRHVKGSTSESPGNMALGATGLARDSYNAGFYIGKELAMLGIRMNFAPVVDIATNPNSSIIGPRAFSDDPAQVAKLGAAFARGSLAAGVIPTAKHFPGHGATDLDSHGTLPEIDIDYSTFIRRERSVYAYLVREGMPAIMSGHIAYPRLAGSSIPASQSYDLIEGELRKKLRFDGLVITDDLYMAGALEGATLLDVCEKAIRAGNDMILLSSTPDPKGLLWKSLLDLYRKDESFRARVRAAVVRVMTIKIEYLKPHGRNALVPDPAFVKMLLPDPGAQAFFAELAQRSASIVGTKQNLPFKAQPKGSILIAGPFDSFISIGKQYYPGAKGFKFSYRPETSANPRELEAFDAKLKGVSAAIVCVANRAGLQFANLAHSRGIPVAIVSVLSPIHVQHSTWAEAVVAVYHYADICLKAGFEILTGKIRNTSKVPLSPRLFK
jgi:beta-N-acetylhexosaminidase